MKFEHQLIFLFSALGAINSFILSVYFLFFNKEKRLSNYFLGGLLLMLSIRIIKSVFLHFNRGLFEIFIQFGLSACFLIGPMLYLYIRSMTSNNTTKIKKIWYWHVIPYIIILIIIAILYPYYQYRTIWGYFVETIYKQWFIYILIAAYHMRHVFKKIGQKKEKFTNQEIWMLNIFLGVSIIYLAYETSSYTSYIVGALSFSFIFYISILLWIYKRLKRPISIDPPIKYANSTLSSKDIELTMQHLNDCIINDKPYLDPNLTLSKLAKKIGVSGKDLSQIINQSTSYNYSKYITKLRIEESKILLQSDKYSNYKIAAIAYESGFNSLSSFNAAFKQFTGITANAFRKKNLES